MIEKILSKSTPVLSVRGLLSPIYDIYIYIYNYIYIYIYLNIYIYIYVFQIEVRRCSKPVTDGSMPFRTGLLTKIEHEWILGMDILGMDTWWPIPLTQCLELFVREVGLIFGHN